ncbi:MAG: sigma-54 dependent transcriptional regulator [Nitrospinota bacterium]|nr:sigma-54 dependent transcriptional regulator [Nitrospinota bacterium]MDH5755992.1 sigma-54 dependent transcriptional regulator [Nitrospinota bacterium]
MLTVLVADDERSMQEFFEVMLVREGYQVSLASTSEEAIGKIERRGIDLVITDINMPKATGMAVLKRSMEVDPDVPVIMITAFATTDTAVEAMKIGAYDYITKPFRVDEIKLVIAKALERRTDKTELKRLKDEVSRAYSLGNIIGKSEHMQSLFRMIKKVAASSSTVLVTGESGTGKELVAKAIHAASDRRDMPFLSINCGAMPEQLLESELFGHQRGSFTGAVGDKKGLLEVADKGTFLLDEVGEAPMSVQVKMLRVLQEREFKRVGGVQDIKVDVRIIAATNKNLEDEIKAGRFREDFFYRLNIIPLHIPPLRERREDIPLIVIKFIEKYGLENGKKGMTLSSETMELLERHQWRGNVRELENVIERAVVLANGMKITPENLPDEIRGGDGGVAQDPWGASGAGVDLEGMLTEMEKKYLVMALQKADGLKREAAKLVNMSFRSFRYKVKKYGIEDQEKDDDEEV